MPSISDTSSSILNIPRIRELDGLRGIASLMVLIHHVFLASVPHPEDAHWPIGALYLLSGALGVDLFFVLSGFLITSILLRDRNQPCFYWNFYWKRALRILPLFLLVLALLAILVPDARPYALLSALFLANFSPVFHVAADGPFWTLAIEEQFYFVWPQFARRLPLPELQQLALALVGMCLALRLVAAFLGHHDFRLTFFHSDGLALGSLLACQRFRHSGTSLPLSARLPPRIMISITAMTITVLPTFVGSMCRLRMVAEAFQVLGVTLLSCGIVAMVIRHRGAPALAVLRSPLLNFFSVISYCVYMSHTYILKLLPDRPEASGSHRLAERLLFVLTATVALSVISRFAIELPALRLRKYVLRRL